MAGVSQKASAEEILPLVSRNVFTEGFEGSSRPTEFLVLLRRYVVQAHELASLAAQTGMVLRVSNCDQAAPLLHILGYRARPNCGEPGTSLLTDDPERAFLAIDSGFPLPALERALQGGKPFEYPYASDPVPVLFAESDWTQVSRKNLRENSRDLLDTILYDPSVARLYWALSRMDRETGVALQQSVGLEKLVPYGGVLDFYGRELCISNGRVSVPGGPHAAAAWKELVGADPASPAIFVPKLLSKDRGWLAAYFDVLSRADTKHREYFTEPHRLRLFYSGLRAPDPKATATRGTFRPAPWLLLLATQLKFDESGSPLVPGGLDEWRDILFHGGESGLVQRWGRQTNEELKSPDQLVKIMFALSRAPSENNALQMYMGISELDSRRAPEQRLEPDTVRLLAHRFEDFSAQYRIFSEFPELNDQSIKLFLQTAAGLNNVAAADRGNALGMFQANVGIWQILARQGQIPDLQLNNSWQEVIKPFGSIHSAAQLYVAGRSSVAELFRFSTGKPIISQDKIIDLVAGPAPVGPAAKQMHQETVARIRSVLDDQRLVSLDTLMIVGDGLNTKAHGKQPEEYVVLLASQTREFQMPRPIFTTGERDEWASGVYNNHHTDLQMKTDLPKVLKSNASAKQIDEARGHLASFLRDTLVGLNYAYYEPPGAQALHNNPLLVRSHDFAGDTVSGIKYLWQEPQVFGQGSPAGGGAHFVGSLADLPYALADLEQDFLSPDNVQALIWNEVTPGLLANSSIPRWWNVSPAELHAVALYQRAGEELLTASVKDEALRTEVLTILSDRMLPPQSKHLEQALGTGNISEVVPKMMPADTFYLAVQYREKHPEKLGEFGSAAQELQQLTEQHADQIVWKRVSRDFGSPHPVLAENYGTELLNVRPMPPFAGSASRLVAESWDSPNLYWARLADERGCSPVLLNHLVPELTRRMVEKIFATDFEDWPALLRAMHEAGDDFRDGKVAVPAIMSASRP